MNTQKRNKKLLLLFSSIFLSFALLTGCFGEKQSDAQVQADFDAFMNEIFVTEIQKDGITFNYTLTQPETYGIEEIPDTLGEYSLEAQKEELAVTENYLTTLENFSYRQLTSEQKLTYDILKDYLAQTLEGSDFLLYQSCLSKTIGLQAQLPILFAEYHFSDEASVENYLTLLADIERYYQQIQTFEELKIKEGFFMSHATATDIIEQCQNFISKKEDNLLIEVFNDQIDSMNELSMEEKEAYKEKNKSIVLDSVIPAYKSLISFLTENKDNGINSGGLCYFPEGKSYYQHLVASSTGSDKSIKEMDEALDTLLVDSVKTMQELSKQDTTILEKAIDISYPMTDPEEILSYLEDAIKEEYPELTTVDYNIKYVHESLQPSISPAFYLTPPIDDDTQNSIYINPYKDYNMDTIFTTLAHEGFPGHLYQNVYFDRTNPAAVRSLINYTGYSEGWATYVEMDSYYLSGIDNTLAAFLRANNLATLCMYGKVDIGVNYYGWDLEEVKEYLAQFGVTDIDTIKEIYQAMIAEPGNYLNYILGYIEFVELREIAEKKQGASFDAKEFHEFVLSVGPANFNVINAHLKNWLKN